jgi:quercetin dioxygenase-like cupin family protein
MRGGTAVTGKGNPHFINIADAPKLEQMPGLETTVLTGLHGERMMMVLNATLPGHTVPSHSHPHEQVGMVYAGTATLRIGDEERIVHQGDFYRIPANVPHSDSCIGNEAFVMLDVFHPVRADFIERLMEVAPEQQ